MWQIYHRILRSFDNITLNLSAKEWVIVVLAMVVVGFICMRGHSSSNL